MKNFNFEIMNVNEYLINHKKEFNIEIGKKIREYRKINNITTKEFAFRSMMSQTYIIQIENGIYGLTLSKFITICNSLGIAPSQILNDFVYVEKNNEILLFNEVQKEKNISKNIINYLKCKQ